MLKLRILTISFLLPLFIWLLLFASNTIFLWTTAVIIGIATVEWIKLLKINNLISFILLICCLAIILLFICNKDLLFDNKLYINLMMQVAGAFWLLILGYILLTNTIQDFCYSKTSLKNKVGIKIKKYLWLIFCFAYFFLGIIPSWLAINYLKIHDKYLLIFACSIIIVADVGAYITGKIFGKHKLTIISPKKTWEGFAGGYIGSLLICWIYFLIVNMNSRLNTVVSLILLTSLTFVFSVVGDLFESLLKRIADVKDSGHILPGHGGILDRIDSFCAGVPVFLLFILN
jgi:phosphatidate cytidylyltransferase